MRAACAPHYPAEPRALVGADVLSLLEPAQRQARPGAVVRRIFAVADAARFDTYPADTRELLALQPELERVLEELEAKIRERQAENPTAAIVASMVAGPLGSLLSLLSLVVGLALLALTVLLMIKAYNKVPNINLGNAVWYMSSPMMTWLQIQARATPNVALTYDQFEGRRVTSFMGIPIRVVDAITSTESVVS